MKVYPVSSLDEIQDESNLGAQYHIQTDEGPERFFRYKTTNGQYRKEKRLNDGTVIGTYSWLDGNGVLRQKDYIADNAGYRILKSTHVLLRNPSNVDSPAVTNQDDVNLSPVLLSDRNKHEDSTQQSYYNNFNDKHSINPPQINLRSNKHSPEDKSGIVDTTLRGNGWNYELLNNFNSLDNRPSNIIRYTDIYGVKRLLYVY